MRNATATKKRMAVSPGGPMMFSRFCTTKSPCFPPGLKMRLGMIGAMNLAKVTDIHSMITIMQKNHFHRFSL
ncbi:Uncharacterised protein [Segatella copri]|nr:Uncharacterised protein [Segatella copri]